MKPLILLPVLLLPLAGYITAQPGQASWNFNSATRAIGELYRTGGGSAGTTAGLAITYRPGDIPGPDETYEPRQYDGGPGVAISPYRQKLLDESADQGTRLLNSRGALASENQLLTDLQILGRKLDAEFGGSTGASKKYWREVMHRWLGTKDEGLEILQLYKKMLNQLKLSDIDGSVREHTVNQLLAWNEFQEALRSEFERAGGAKYPQIYLEWRSSSKNSYLDYNVFAYNRLSTKEERNAFFNDLPPWQRKEFHDNYSLAAKRGWVTKLSPN
jgi:hypothetical protein